ncbi:MAG TPA: hypothetical protein IGR64_12015 [Leptolyngbyaceae cyanobacterium M65_K2018_010]|nr:hypothetical protein [Leptolyngbyaceae cyanobacterium M65_K2018_010]
MTPQDLEFLRQLCRDQQAFEQLTQFLDEQDALNREFAAKMAQQRQRTQALEAQKRASEAASQAKSQFLAMMSHELRTPLNAILGLSSLLAQQVVGELNAKQMEYLTYIHESGEHLLALISDILDLSKVEAGQEKLRLTEVALPALCHSCIAMVQTRAEAKGLPLSFQVASNAEVCTADERRLRQMLLNLLANAIKFTDAGHVSLRVQRQGTMIEFEVEDTGIGIPADKREQLFQPFTQLDNRLNRRYEGTGLGLALTQQLAQLHGGYLTVESEENCGSRFLLYLPGEARPSVASSLNQANPGTEQTSISADHKQRSGLKSPTALPPTQEIVLVDDELDHHQPLVSYVQTCGWQIYSLRSWDDACHYMEKFPPRLLIVGDFSAQQPTLTHHIQQIRQHPATQNTKVVVMRSSNWLDRDATDADACLDLPLTIPKLERILAL